MTCTQLVHIGNKYNYTMCKNKAMNYVTKKNVLKRTKMLTFIVSISNSKIAFCAVLTVVIRCVNNFLPSPV